MSEGYKLVFKINGSEADLPPGAVNFSLRDSIWGIFPTGDLVLNDPSGLLKENGFMTDGLPVDIDLNFDGKLISSETVVKDFESRSNTAVGMMSGDLAMKLISKNYLAQTGGTGAFSGTISDVITKIGKNIGFSKTDMEATVGKKIWYQRGLLEGDFIEDVLLPNAMTGEATTPYCVFGTLDKDKTLFGKSVATLSKSAPSLKIMFSPRPNMDPASYNAIDIVPFTQGLSRMDLLKNTASGVSLEDLSEVVTDFAIGKGKFLGGSKLPILTKKAPVSTLYTGQAIKEDLKFLTARQIWALRTYIFTERLKITLPFNPGALSGKVIDLSYTVPGKTDNEYAKGLYYSGSWLVEGSAHHWIGAGKRAFSEIVVGRKMITPPEGSLLKGNYLAE